MERAVALGPSCHHTGTKGIVMAQGRSEFKGGWKTLLAGFLGTMCGASPVPFNVLGFLLEPLNTEFGWSRTQVSLGITIFGVTAALSAPVFGWLADRHGVRKVGILSLIAFIVSFAAFSVIPGSLVAFYLLWFVVGAVAIGSTPVVWSRAVAMWFVRNRGLALGIMLLGTSAAAFIVPRMAVWALDNGGWRMIFPTVALLPLLIALPAVIGMFREPRPDEISEDLKSSDGSTTGMTFGEAIRTRQFWLLWCSIFMIALAYGGAHSHMPSIVKDHGIDIAAAAGIMGIVGAGLLIGRVAVGALLDRFWGPGVAFPVLCLPAIACFLLLGTSSDMTQISIAAFLLGFAAGAESDLIAFMAARYFGMAQYGRIYGSLYMPFALMSAISPVVYGMTRDSLGSYDPILTFASVAFVVGGALLLLMGRYPDKMDSAK